MGQESVLLFRAEEKPSDRYRQLLEKKGFRVFFCAPVRFVFRPLDRIERVLASYARYGGLLLTSPRVIQVLKQIENERSRVLAPWKQLPVFTVGTRSADRLRALGFRTVYEGQGTAISLLPVLRDVHSGKPMLFLSGSTRRAELVRALTQEGLSFHEHVVYESYPVHPLKLPSGSFDWFVFFSPLGVQTVYEQYPGLMGRKVAIGPTTAQELARVDRGAVHVASRPTPEAVAEILSNQGKE